jgi:hypothetical protein
VLGKLLSLLLVWFEEFEKLDSLPVLVEIMPEGPYINNNIARREMTKIGIIFL